MLLCNRKTRVREFDPECQIFMEKPLTSHFVEMFNTMPEEAQDVVLMYPPDQRYIVKNTREEVTLLGYHLNTKTGPGAVCFTVAAGMQDGETIVEFFPEELELVNATAH